MTFASLLPQRMLLLPRWVLALVLANGYAASAMASDLGFYLGAGCDGAKRLPAVELWLGKRVVRIVDFADASSWTAMTRSTDWILQCWSGKGYKLSLSLPMLPREEGTSLARGALGHYDQVFVAIAQSLVRRGFADAVLRVGWEFNGRWYPWAAARDPEAWVAYWRRIVDVMRSVPGAHFTFEWCPNIGLLEFDPEQVYPGDDYVDLIGMDVYNDRIGGLDQSPERRWQHHLERARGLRWHVQFAARHNKPISYPEWGTGSRPNGLGAEDDPFFIRQMAGWIALHRPAYQAYWNYPAHDFYAAFADGRFPQSERAFLEAFGAGGK